MSETDVLSKDIKKNKEILSQRLPIGKSFDVIGRELVIGQREAYIVFLDGFAKDDIMLWVLNALQSLKKEDICGRIVDILLKKKIAYIEVSKKKSLRKLYTRSYRAHCC